MKSRFEKIYQEQKDTVYGYLYYMSRDEQTSLDLSQETFLKVYRSLDRFKGQCSEKTWCLTIARNTFLSYARKRQPQLLEEEAWERMADSAGGPEESALRSEQKITVRRVLASLSEPERTVLLLRDYEGLSYKEIGEIMEVSEVVIKGRIFRARQHFKSLYEAMDGGACEKR